MVYMHQWEELGAKKYSLPVWQQVGFKPAWDFGNQTWDFGVQTWDFGVQIWDFGIQTWDFGIQPGTLGFMHSQKL